MKKIQTWQKFNELNDQNINESKIVYEYMKPGQWYNSQNDNKVFLYIVELLGDNKFKFIVGKGPAKVTSVDELNKSNYILVGEDKVPQEYKDAIKN